MRSYLLFNLYRLPVFVDEERVTRTTRLNCVSAKAWSLLVCKGKLIDGLGASSTNRLLLFLTVDSLQNAVAELNLDLFDLKIVRERLIDV